MHFKLVSGKYPFIFEPTMTNHLLKLITHPAPVLITCNPILMNRSNLVLFQCRCVSVIFNRPHRLFTCRIKGSRITGHFYLKLGIDLFFINPQNFSIWNNQPVQSGAFFVDIGQIIGSKKYAP